MRDLKKILVCLMTMVMCIGILTLPAFAAPVSQDGLEITLTTDKESYGKNDDIIVTLTVTNTNDEAVSNVSLEQVIPDGYILADGSEATKELDSLAAGETTTLTVTLVVDTSSTSAVTTSGNTKTGDDTNIYLVVGMLVLAAGGIVILVVKNRQGKKLLSILLCVSMMGGLVSKDNSVKALEGNETASVETTVEVDGNDLNLSAIVTYTLSGETSTSSTYYTVTFDSNGGSEVESQKVAEGKTATVPNDPTKDGYEFFGWYYSNGYSQPFDFDQEITSDITIYAKWYDESDTTDTDGDGLIDSLEEAFGTDPTKKDTDNDGISDYYELNWINTNPLVEDTDGNGILDSEEDADEDGLTNAEEEALGLNPIYKDSDYDSITDYDEINTYGTDPNNEDSDGDGVIDGTEVSIGSDPLTAESTFVTEKSYGEVSEYTPVVVSAMVETDAEGAGTLTIDDIDVTDNILISQSIPGYLGCAYDFSVEGNLISATITFEYDTSLGTVGDTFQPCIYYFNEDEGTFEELDSTINTDGTVSAKVSHFSTYILLNKIAFDEVWENDIKLPDETSTTMTGLDVVFVIDSSGSMAWNDSDGIRKDVVKAFVDKLGEDDRAAVIDFDDSAKIYQTFTSDHDALYTAIEKIDSSGGTNLSNGMKSAISQFTSDDYTREDAYKYIIFLTDGDGTYSTTYTTQAAENGIVVYTIGLGDGVKESVLTAIAEGTGGKYYFASSASSLSTIFDDVAFETIDYSTDSNNDGISDYYTELINNGELVLSSGSSELIGVTDMYGEESDDWDGDGLKNGEEISVVNSGGKIYIKMISDPLFVDTDGDSYSDYEEVKEMNTSPTKFTQSQSLSLKQLMDDSTYTYIEYSVDGTVASKVKNCFDWQKTEESKELMIDYFYDYASEDTINANADAIAKLERKETIVSILDTIATILETTNTIINDMTTMETDSNKIRERVKEINEERVVLFEKVNLNDEKLEEQMKDVQDSLDIIKTDTNLLKEGLNTVENIADIETKVAAATSVISTFSKILEVKLFSVGDSLDKFANNYQIFKGTNTSLGISNGTVISVVSDVADTAIDIAETCNTYGKIQANTEAFEENLDILVYIYQNCFESYIRTAAGDVADIILDGSWSSYYSQLSAAALVETGLGALKVALDIAGDLNPYVKIINTYATIFKAALEITGISETVKIMLKTEVIRSLSDGCISCLDSLVEIGTYYFSYSIDSYGTVQRLMTQLAQSRIIGEDCMETAYTNDNVINGVTYIITGTNKSELTEAYEKWILSIYTNADLLNLTLSSKLPQYPYTNTSTGGR